jgi:3D (Asp-Asp-Asp) domain-containing protein
MKKSIYILTLILVAAFIQMFTNKGVKYSLGERCVITDTIRSAQCQVTATCYYPVTSQCDSDPLVTAGMYKINPDSASEYKWIAMSRDLIKRWNGNFNYGDLVEIRGAGHKDGIYKVVDTMNKRFTNRIDFLEKTGTKQYKFEDVTLTKITWKQKNLLASL